MKSPRRMRSARISWCISAEVRMPMRRITGSGGYRPTSACSTRKPGDRKGQCQEAPIDRGAESEPQQGNRAGRESEPQQGNRAGVGFDGALDIPFALQLADALRERGVVGTDVTRQVVQRARPGCGRCWWRWCGRQSAGPWREENARSWAHLRVHDRALLSARAAPAVGARRNQPGRPRLNAGFPPAAPSCSARR